MTRISQFIIAVFFAAIVGVAGLAPARAASLPAGAITGIEQATKPAAESVRYHYRRRHYRPVRVYRRHYYRPYPVYRRCWTRPRLVWTPYGYVRRWVRICR